MSRITQRYTEGGGPFRLVAERLLIGKAKHPLLDGTGAFLVGGRWNSPGRQVIYGSTCLAGCLLEILVHAGLRQKLPGAHLCVRAQIPEDLMVESVDEEALVGWDARILRV